eukprot:765760-Hanusia_phi.AAC.1
MVQVPPLHFASTPSCTTLRRKRRLSTSVSSPASSISSSPRAPIAHEYSLLSPKPSWKTLSFRSSAPGSSLKRSAGPPKFLNFKTSLMEPRRVDSVVSGEVSGWSAEIPKELAANLFGVRYSEDEKKYIRAEDELTKNSQDAMNYLIQKFMSAQRSSRRFLAEKSKLGMSGDMRHGNSLNDLDRVRDGVRDTLLTDRRRSEEVFSPILEYKNRMEEENLLYVKSPFTFLGQDPDDEGIFYFEQER